MNYKQKLFLFFIVLSFVLQFGFIYQLVTQQGGYAATINVADEQRMLSQRVAFAANMIAEKSLEHHHDNAIEIMKDSIKKMRLNHQYLLSGNIEKGILPITSKSLKRIYFDEPYLLDEHMKKFQALATKVIESAEQDKLVNGSEDLKVLTELAVHELLQTLGAAAWQYQIEHESIEEKHNNIEYMILGFMLISFIMAGLEFISSTREALIKSII